jgi:DNA-binding PadR family transcriptional regulator
MSSLSPTAKIILGFLRFRARSGYDIKQAVEVSTRFFWGASFGQIYPELKRLKRDGLVEVQQTSEEGRRRRVYALTAAGQRAFEDWLASDSDAWIFQYRDEGVLRLFFSDFAAPEEALANVRRMREWREEVVSFLRADIQPHAQEDVELGYEFPARALGFGLVMLEAQAAWLRKLESELDNG